MRLLGPEQPGFADASRKPFVAHLTEPVPAAVALCTEPGDVVEAVAYARRHDLPVAIRSGGHCGAGHSSTNGLLIDLSGLNTVRLEHGLAVVGPGTRLAGMVERLAVHGLAVPAGTCPTVGVGGLTLGGGWGLLARMYGLTCDHLVRADVVLADGRNLTVFRELSPPDLFWALRGAGCGHFGVVTSLALKPRPAPRMTNFRHSWDYRHAPRLIDTWQRWAPYAPDEMTASLLLSAPGDPGVSPTVELYGAMASSGPGTALLLEEFCERADAVPERAELTELSYLETARFHAALEDGGSDAVRHKMTTSEFFDRPVLAGAIDRLVGSLTESRTAGESRDIEFAPWGGAVNRVPWHATAFVHRTQRFSVEHIAMVEGSSPEAALRWARASQAALHPWGTGFVYQNFADPGLDDWDHAYYGANLPRLKDIKTRHDPDGLFR